MKHVVCNVAQSKTSLIIQTGSSIIATNCEELREEQQGWTGPEEISVDY